LLSLLDEECIMPKGSDETFTSKVYEIWEGNSKQFKPSRIRNKGFILTHYAADVEYSTHEWLSKNKDPLNDNITNLIVNSSDSYFASLFEALDSSRRVKKGIFRTVAQRHKEQLGSLMTQLNSTQPHFVRCIIPNERKTSRVFTGPLVLDQLRCNGVLEGIRIARTGFPNRLTFTEFRQRYELLTTGLPKGFMESRNAAQMILADLDLDKNMYQLGRTKVFFRAGLVYPRLGSSHTLARGTRRTKGSLHAEAIHELSIFCSRVYSTSSGKKTPLSSGSYQCPSKELACI
jgi:myosin protein heavy chain